MARTQFFRSRKKSVPLPMIYRNSPDVELNLKLIPHAHLMAVAAGRAEENEFLTVVFRVVVGSTMTVYVDDEGRLLLEDIFRNAINGLVSVGERYKKLGKFGCSGDELRDIKEALNTTDDLQTVSTRKQQAEMYKITERFVGGFDYTMDNLKKLQARLDQ